MPKRLSGLSASAALLLASWMWLANRASGAELVLTAPGAPLSQGNSAIALVVYRGSESVSALQFDVEFDDSVIELALVTGDGVRSTQKSLTSQRLQPNRLRIALAGINQEPLSELTLLKLYIHVKADAPAGTTRVALLHPVAASPEGVGVTLRTGEASLELTGIRADPASILSPEQVLHAASLKAGPVAPGMMLSLLGAGIGNNGPRGEPVQVLFNGVPAALIYQGENQINLVTPPTLPTSGNVVLQLWQGKEQKAELTLPAVTTTPGLFTADASGSGLASATLPNGMRIDSNTPVERGGHVVLYATGLGPIGEWPEAAGTANSPNNALRVQIGGRSVLFSLQPVPETANAVVRIDASVPPDLAASALAPVVLSVNSASSQPYVLIPVR